MGSGIFSHGAGPSLWTGRTGWAGSALQLLVQQVSILAKYGRMTTDPPPGDQIVDLGTDLNPHGPMTPVHDATATVVFPTDARDASNIAAGLALTGLLPPALAGDRPGFRQRSARAQALTSSAYQAKAVILIKGHGWIAKGTWLLTTDRHAINIVWGCCPS